MWAKICSAIIEGGALQSDGDKTDAVARALLMNESKDSIGRIRQCLPVNYKSCRSGRLSRVYIERGEALNSTAVFDTLFDSIFDRKEQTLQ